MKKINREKFKEILELVKPGLAAKEIVEQATSFCFIDGKVITYNDEISISHPLKEVDLTGAVNAEELYGYVNKVKADEISMELSDGEILLKAGRSKVGLRLKSEITLPYEEIGKIKEWKKLPDDFCSGLAFAMSSCSRFVSSPILGSVHVNGKFIEGSDDNRVAQYKLVSKLDVKPFLLDADIASKVIKFLPEYISEGTGWIHFKTNANAIISCRILEEDYPDTKNVFKMENPQEIELPQSLLNVINRASVFSKRDHVLDEMLTINIANKKLTVSSENEAGWFKEPTRINSDIEVDFSISPYLLKDILKDTKKGILGENKLLFKAENWKYITLLLD